MDITRETDAVVQAARRKIRREASSRVNPAQKRGDLNFQSKKISSSSASSESGSFSSEEEQLLYLLQMEDLLRGNIEELKEESDAPDDEGEDDSMTSKKRHSRVHSASLISLLSSKKSVKRKKKTEHLKHLLKSKLAHSFGEEQSPVGMPIVPVQNGFPKSFALPPPDVAPAHETLSETSKRLKLMLRRIKQQKTSALSAREAVAEQSHKQSQSIQFQSQIFQTRNAQRDALDSIQALTSNIHFSQNSDSSGGGFSGSNQGMFELIPTLMDDPTVTSDPLKRLFGLPTEEELTERKLKFAEEQEDKEIAEYEEQKELLDKKRAYKRKIEAKIEARKRRKRRQQKGFLSFLLRIPSLFFQEEDFERHTNWGALLSRMPFYRRPWSRTVEKPLIPIVGRIEPIRKVMNDFMDTPSYFPQPEDFEWPDFKPPKPRREPWLLINDPPTDDLCRTKPFTHQRSPPVFINIGAFFLFKWFKKG